MVPNAESEIVASVFSTAASGNMVPGSITTVGSRSVPAGTGCGDFAPVDEMQTCCGYCC